MVAAAEDVREKIHICPLLRDEVEPRVLRFDPASRRLVNRCCLTPEGVMSRRGLTNWADQVLQRKLENVRGVFSRAGWRHQARNQCMRYLNPRSR
jgi:HAE1 family hydrophobic/amphiphilic exporter-1